jgi:prepilin-type N-terminal cleavage/methylation domain-containing protein
MDRPINKNNSFGFTLVELMVSLAVGSLVSLAAVSAFTAQSSVIVEQTMRMQAEEQGREVHAVLTRLLRQAHRSSLPTSTATDVIDFTVPAGVPIWPNEQAPYSDNAIQIKYDAAAHTISIGNGAPADNISALTVLSGNSSGTNPRIIAMSLKPEADGIRYTFTITSQAGDRTDVQSTFESTIIPRN